MRVAVVDIGTNSTRLLIADVSPDGSLHEHARRSQVTRLGEGVDARGELSPAAIDRVTATLDEYSRAIEQAEVASTVAVLTSAVRDAGNGPAFREMVADRYGIDARVLPGEEEARLTFLGAMAGREHGERPAVVIDIGGGSTEFVIGRGETVEFRVSTQVGVVRQTERHLHTDPPEPEQLQALAADVRAVFADSIPEGERERAASAVAVAGTATSCAAILQELEPYDPARVHGYALELGECDLLLARLAAMTESERRGVVGLHPDRAPTIVAGVAVLIEAMRGFGLEQVEVSERDLLHGAARRAAASSAA